jgi:hypothetical protein
MRNSGVFASLVISQNILSDYFSKQLTGFYLANHSTSFDDVHHGCPWHLLRCCSYHRRNRYLRHADSQLPHSPGDLCPRTLKEPRSWNPHPGPGTGCSLRHRCLACRSFADIMTKLVLLHVKTPVLAIVVLWFSLIALGKERSGLYLPFAT